MDKLFNLNSTFKSEPQEDGSVMVRGMASTKDFDRAGDSIMAEAWTKGGLGNFEKNPIILFNHDYSNKYESNLCPKRSFNPALKSTNLSWISGRSGFGKRVRS